MKAFVTGGTGFVGAHLVQALLARGDQVTCLVRRPELAQRLGWTGRGVTLVRGDLGTADALQTGCTGADVVFHVAGVIAARDAAEFMACNRDGTANVLEAAIEAGVGRFLLVSSLAVGGPTTPGHPIDENRPPAPVTDYGRSKLAAELLVRAMPGGAWTIVRPPVVYGEWDRATLKIFQLVKRGIAPVLGDGSQELSVIHGADLAAALVAAATAPAAAGRVYYAAHAATTTSRGLVLACGQALGRAGPPWVLPIPGWLARGVLWSTGTLAHLAGRATLLSADKAAEYLAPAWTCRGDALTRDSGWRADIALEAGLRRAADWYREVGWL